MLRLLGVDMNLDRWHYVPRDKIHFSWSRSLIDCLLVGSAAAELKVTWWQLELEVVDLIPYQIEKKIFVYVICFTFCKIVEPSLEHCNSNRSISPTLQSVCQMCDIYYKSSYFLLF